MKTENLNRIKSLLDKYDLGQTSLEEEQVLMTYFQSKEVPLDLHNYQTEFNYYSAFKNIRFTGSLEDGVKTEEPSIFKKISHFFSKWYGLFVVVLLASILSILILPNGQIEEVQANLTQENEATIFPVNSDSIPPKWIVSKIEDLALPSPSESVSSKKISSPINDSAPAQKISSQFRDTLIKENSPSKNVLPPLQKKDSTINSTERASTLIPLDSIAFNNRNSEQKSIKIDTIEPKEVLFNITENSTSGELYKIARMADKAGIEYTYVVDMHRKKIHELNIVMVIRSTGVRTQLWISVPKKSGFKEVLSWTEDENGQAVSLCSPKVEHTAKAKHPLE